MSLFARPVALVNGGVVTGNGLASSIRFSDRVLALDEPPARGDAVLDLEGAFVLPGLVNAHDHLELNHFGKVKFRSAYENASDWIDDMRPRLRGDARIREAAAHRLSDRLLIGGLKNLLAGATTVAHHNPLYRAARRGFPVRVVRRFGWAHSFALEGEPVGARGERGPDVAQAYRKTRADAPFLIHLAEGIDPRAREELSRLADLGCLGANTVLVHGVAIPCEEWTYARSRGAGLVWCPSSNLFLLGRTASIAEFLRCAPQSRDGIALGTDSRLTGSRDLLDEIRVARQAASLPAEDLLRMVTTNAARLLKLPAAGRLERGVPADLFVIPRLAPSPAESLHAARRDQVLLVAVGGSPAIGAPELAEVFRARRVPTERVLVDGAERLLSRTVVAAVRRCAIREPGLDF